MNSLLDQAFPYPDERKLYLIILATALCGQTLEKFFNAKMVAMVKDFLMN